jgi:hypothetical protein
MAITNTSKPTTSVTNTTKSVQYETWDSNTSTWDTETRTWDGMSTIWTNQPSIQFQFLQLESGGYLLIEGLGKLIIASGSNITNISKP